jgi:ATP-dependent Clp protease ATP-binding subunit ClpA
MFELFTEPARRVIFFARSEAAQCGSAFIETEHLLAGVLGQDHALALQLFGSEEAVTALRAKASSPEVATPASTSVDLPLTRESSRVLAYAAEEGQRLAHRYIGTEHLLLGLMREENSRAAQALRESGLELASLRERFAQQQSHDPEVRRREQLHHLVDDLPPELWDSAEEALRAIRSGVAIHGPEATRPSVPGVLARYTEKARRTIFFSRFEASQFGAKSIESEHLLLGLMREYSHLRDRLVKAGTSPREIRKEIEQRKPPAAEKVPTSVDLPLSQECKRAMAFATEEADRLNHKHIGNEHLLAGLLREENCLAAELLRAHGITLEAARTDLEKRDSST